MAEISFTCSSCQAEYALPETYRQHLDGRAVFCVQCRRWWVPVPAADGPSVRLVKGRPERAPVDLRKFRRGAPAPAAEPEADATARVPVAPKAPSLRVAVVTPGKEVKAVFDLGEKSFLIGKAHCHLNLKQAQVPDKAIRIRSQGEGFQFEGVDGFQIPIGSMSVGSGQLEPGGSLSFKLEPYEIRLEISATPGRPIADLEKATAAPVAPPPAPPRPASPPPPRPPAISPPMPPRPAGRAVDLRQQVQELAVEVRPDQRAFNDYQAVQEALDGDATITDLGAQGFQAMRFGNVLAGLELSLVRQEGPLHGQAFRITKSPVVIGRKDGDMIVHDGRVSSKHAQLDIGGPRIYTLKDLASTNGTTINDRPVSVGHLQDGDVVSFGGVKFEFRARKVG
jgi:FHA domain